MLMNVPWRLTASQVAATTHASTMADPMSAPAGLASSCKLTARAVRNHDLVSSEYEHFDAACRAIATMVYCMIQAKKETFQNYRLPSICCHF